MYVLGLGRTTAKTLRMLTAWFSEYRKETNGSGRTDGFYPPLILKPRFVAEWLVAIQTAQTQNK